MLRRDGNGRANQLAMLIILTLRKFKNPRLVTVSEGNNIRVILTEANTYSKLSADFVSC